MRKEKTEILLNAIIVVLAVILAITWAFDGKWFIAALFMVIGILNIVMMILRLKKQYLPPDIETTQQITIC